MRWPPGPRQVIIGGAILLVLAVVAYLLPIAPWSPLYPCDDGLRSTSDGGCVGVSASSDFGDPALRSAMNALALENSRVPENVPFYTIGYVVPLPAASGRNSLSDELRHEIEGAVVAQARANRTNELVAGAKIKLVVGNTGPGGEAWSEVSARFHQMAAESDNLRAVAGMGTSIDTTVSAISDLTQQSPDGPALATIGARLTGDDLSAQPNARMEQGFFRVAETNTDEALAAVDWIRSQGFQRPLLVKDRSASDGYVKSLAEGFRSVVNDAPEETYIGSPDGLATAMESVVLNICVAQPLPDVVYFAGRGDALAQFVDLLGSRQCRDKPLTVVTGDDIDTTRDAARDNSGGTRVALTESNLRVAYTGIAEPQMWQPPHGLPGAFSPLVVNHFTSSCDTCWTGLPAGDLIGDGKRLENENLDDDAGLMGHDATAVAITAIRRAANGVGSPDKVVSAEAVIQVLYQVRGASSLAGASGQISMSTCGEAKQKLFPLLVLQPNGTQLLDSPQTARGQLPC